MPPQEKRGYCTIQLPSSVTKPVIQAGPRMATARSGMHRSVGVPGQKSRLLKALCHWRVAAFARTISARWLCRRHRPSVTRDVKRPTRPPHGLEPWRGLRAVRTPPRHIMAAAGIALALAALTACGGNAGTSSTPPAPRPPASSQAPAAGPFTVTLTYCGKLSAAQQAQFTTSAAAGLIATAVNHGSQPYAVQASAEFVSGTAVAGSNVSGFGPVIDPGQSVRLEIDNLAGETNGNPADTCRLTGYAVQSAAGQVILGPYQGGWPLSGSMPGTK